MTCSFEPLSQPWQLAWTKCANEHQRVTYLKTLAEKGNIVAISVLQHRYTQVSFRGEIANLYGRLVDRIGPTLMSQAVRIGRNFADDRYWRGSLNPTFWSCKDGKDRLFFCKTLGLTPIDAPSTNASLSPSLKCQLAALHGSKKELLEWALFLIREENSRKEGEEILSSLLAETPKDSDILVNVALLKALCSLEQSSVKLPYLAYCAKFDPYVWPLLAMQLSGRRGPYHELIEQEYKLQPRDPNLACAMLILGGEKAVAEKLFEHIIKAHRHVSEPIDERRYQYMLNLCYGYYSQIDPFSAPTKELLSCLDDIQLCHILHVWIFELLESESIDHVMTSLSFIAQNIHTLKDDLLFLQGAILIFVALRQLPKAHSGRLLHLDLDRLMDHFEKWQDQEVLIEQTQYANDVISQLLEKSFFKEEDDWIHCAGGESDEEGAILLTHVEEESVEVDEVALDGGRVKRLNAIGDILSPLMGRKERFAATPIQPSLEVLMRGFDA